MIPRWHIHRWNTSENTFPFLGLHGFTGSGLDFEALPGLFPKHPFFAPDILGHGLSPLSKSPTNYRLPNLLSQLDLVIEQLTPPPILLAYSMGARLGLHYALKFRHKLKALILIGVSPGITDKEERKSRQFNDQALANFIAKQGLASFLQTWQHNPIIRTQITSNSTWSNRAWTRKNKLSPLGLEHCLREFGVGNTHPVEEELKLLNLPVLLLTGDSDQKFTEIAQSMLPLLPMGRHSLIKNSGHAAHLENPEMLAHVINSNWDFLNTGTV